MKKTKLIIKYFIFHNINSKPTYGIYRIHPEFKEGFDDLISAANTLNELCARDYELNFNPYSPKRIYYNMSIFRFTVINKIQFFEGIKNVSIRVAKAFKID